MLLKGGNVPVPPEKQLYILLWYLSNLCSMRQVSQLYNVSMSTVHKVVTNTSKIASLVNIMCRKHCSSTAKIQQEILRSATNSQKGRFRRLREIPFHYADVVCYMIIAACVCHNICVLAGDDVEHFIDND
ncbi:uncharacterized protein [Haliotis asinina]|uniref:uncharacterized protein n=1 Tax=Haliotis asinina TaxID=109174 RepID=UPI0035321711